ncbi:MAG TPA: hypothetical protein VHV78_14235, partial [Gemmatimonadaceae bacterium]|nr:hypothetical protein [Gemmatimonadaceae bacterium]
MTRHRARRPSRPARAANAQETTFGSPLAWASAVLLVVACVVPFALWGNPYPDAAIRYWLWGGALALVATAAAIASPIDPMRPLLAALRRPAPLQFAMLVAAVTFALSAFFAVFAFHRAASTSDELAELWHAQILLHGRFSLPVDPNREFFSLENVVDTGRWYSQFPVGGPLILAIGAAFGVPWLVSPVLAAASAALLYHFARRAFGETQGRASAVLFSSAPMLLMMAGTWMNHVPTLFLATCALAALVEWSAAASTRAAMRYAGIIGLAVGGMATIRPLDAIVVASAIGVFQLWAVRTTLIRFRELAFEAACGTVALVPLLYANWTTTGAALRFGYDISWGTGHRVGFHADPYGNVHTLAQGLEYAVTYLGELNMY